MRAKQPDFLELLNAFIEGYMPFIAGLSENTIRLYKATFRLLLTFLYEIKGIDAKHITFKVLNYVTLTEFLNWLETERNCSAATRNVRLAALSSFAAYVQNRNSDAAIVYLTAVQRIPIKKTASVPRVFFTRDEISALLRTPTQISATGYRDTVLLSLMYASGMRAQEVCDLRVRDVFFEQEKTVLTITGKGNKTRRIHIARPCAEMLKGYLRQRGITNQLERHVFSSRTHEHMTISCVEAIFKKHLYVAKQNNPLMFRGKKYSPHTMRHTCAMHMLEAGVSIMAIKNFLGHASVATTEHYAELTQSTVDKHIKEWNERWFVDNSLVSKADDEQVKNNRAGIPSFLK